MSEHEIWANHGAPSVRVRDTYVRDIAGPLLGRGADGVVKLDLVLRGIASGPRSGSPGAVPSGVSWSDLHDMCRGLESHLDSDTPLKQRWVNDKVRELERLQLVRRTSVAGKRPALTVLSDRGDGASYDDPASTSEKYVTFIGDLVRFDHLGSWNSSALAAYFAAMNAEAHARAGRQFARSEQATTPPAGGGRWMRPLSWFSDPRVSTGPDDSVGRPAEHVRYPFNARTLGRGISRLAQLNFIAIHTTSIDPRTGEQLASKFGRRIYYNAFHLAGLHHARRAYHLVKEASANADTLLRGDRT